MQLGALGGLLCSGSGTLGVLVKTSAASSDVFLLSCSHVIANCGQFVVPFAKAPDFRKVVQQPVSDTCDSQANRVGVLQDDFSVFVAESDGVTDSDHALALLDPDVAANSSTIQLATGNSISEFATEDPASWQPGMKTQLLGAVNQGSFGSILGFDGDTAEEITFAGFGTVRFTGLVRYSNSSAEHDSGAAVVDEQNRLLGFHVGGSTSGVALFFPIGPYLLQKGLVLA
jgi:hypothetical protein